MSGIGDADRGRRLIAAVGCDACHAIPGVAPVSWGPAGPPLSGWSKRSYIAGLLPNTPDQLVQWLRTPQTIKPGDAMPNLGLSARDATDIAAYLYTLQ